MDEKLLEFYNGLKANKYVKGLPEDFDTFKTVLQDSSKRAQFYQGIKQNKYIKGLPEDQAIFDKALGFFTAAPIDENLVKQREIEKVQEAQAVQDKLPSQIGGSRFTQSTGRLQQALQERQEEVQSPTLEEQRKAGTTTPPKLNPLQKGMSDYSERQDLGRRQLAAEKPEDMLPILETMYSDLINSSDTTKTTTAKIGEMVGGQIIPIIKTTMASAIGGAVSGPVGVGAAISTGASDAALTGYAASLQEGYIKARLQGLDTEEAYVKAGLNAQAGAIGGVFEGTLGAIPVFGKLLGKIPANKLYRAVASSFLDAGVDATLAGLSKAGQNIYADNVLGLKTEVTEGLVENMTAEAAFSFAINMITGGRGVGTPSQKRAAVEAVIKEKLPESDAASVLSKIEDTLKAKEVTKDVTKELAPEVDAQTEAIIDKNVSDATETIQQSNEAEVQQKAEEDIESVNKDIEKLKDEKAKLTDQKANLKSTEKKTGNQEKRITEKVKQLDQALKENTETQKSLNDQLQQESAPNQTVPKKSQPETKRTAETQQETVTNNKTQTESPRTDSPESTTSRRDVSDTQAKQVRQEQKSSESGLTPKKSNRGGARVASKPLPDAKASTQRANIIKAAEKGDKTSARKRADNFISKYGEQHPKEAKKLKDYFERQDKIVQEKTEAPKTLTTPTKSKEQVEVAKAENIDKINEVKAKRRVQDAAYTSMARAMARNDEASFNKALEKYNEGRKNPVTKEAARKKVTTADLYRKAYETEQVRFGKEKSAQVTKAKKALSKQEKELVKKKAVEQARKKKDADIDSILRDIDDQGAGDVSLDIEFSKAKPSVKGTAEKGTNKVNVVQIAALKSKPVKLNSAGIPGRLINEINTKRSKLNLPNITVRATDNMSSIDSNIAGFYNSDFEVIILSNDYIKSGGSKSLLVHELLHPVTNLLYNGAKGNRITNGRIRAIQQDLNNSYKHSKDYIQSVLDGKIVNTKLAAILSEYDVKSTKDVYGLTNVDEMVSESFSSTEFVSIMAQVPSRKPVEAKNRFRSVLSDIVENIHKFIAEKFGIPLTKSELNNVYDNIQEFNSLLDGNDISVENYTTTIQPDVEVFYKKNKDKKSQEFITELVNELAYNQRVSKTPEIASWVSSINKELVEQGRTPLDNSEIARISKRIGTINNKKATAKEKIKQLSESKAKEFKSFDGLFNQINQIDTSILSQKDLVALNKSLDFFITGADKLPNNAASTRKYTSKLISITSDQVANKFIADTESANFNTRKMLTESFARVFNRETGTARSAQQIATHISGFNSKSAAKVKDLFYNRLQDGIVKLNNKQKAKSDQVMDLVKKYALRQEDLWSYQMRSMIVRSDDVSITDPKYVDVVKNNYKILVESLNKQYKYGTKSDKKRIKEQLYVLESYKDQVSKFDGTADITTNVLLGPKRDVRTKGVNEFHKWVQEQILEYGPQLEVSNKMFWGEEFKWAKTNYSPRNTLGKIGTNEMIEGHEKFLNLLLPDVDPTGGRQLQSQQASSAQTARGLSPEYVYDFNALSTILKFVNEAEVDLNITPEIKRLSFILKNKKISEHIGDKPSQKILIGGISKENKNIDVVIRSLKSAIIEAKSGGVKFDTFTRNLNALSNTVSLAIMAQPRQIVTQYASMLPSIASMNPKGFAKAAATQVQLLGSPKKRAQLNKMLVDNNVGITNRNFLFERGDDISTIGVSDMQGGIKKTMKNVNDFEAKFITTFDKKSALLTWLSSYYQNGGTTDFNNFNAKAARKAEADTEILQNINVSEFSASMFRPRTATGRILMKSLMAFKSFQFNMTLNTLSATTQLFDSYIRGRKSGGEGNAARVLTANLLASLGYIFTADFLSEGRDKLATTFYNYMFNSNIPEDEFKKIEKDFVDYMAIAINDQIFSGLPLGDTFGASFINTMLEITREKYEDVPQKNLPIPQYPPREMDKLGPVGMIADLGMETFERQRQLYDLDREPTQAEYLWANAPMVRLVAILSPIYGKGMLFKFLADQEKRLKVDASKTIDKKSFGKPSDVKRNRPQRIQSERLKTQRKKIERL